LIFGEVISLNGFTQLLKFQNDNNKKKCANTIIGFKIKNPAPVVVGRKKIPRISFIFFGLAQTPAKS
jgi:hypothetical protein